MCKHICLLVIILNQHNFKYTLTYLFDCFSKVLKFFSLDKKISFYGILYIRFIISFLALSLNKLKIKVQYT